MIEEATVDCDNEAEQVVGLLTAIEENLTVPFEAVVLGVTVVVEKVDLNAVDEIITICRRGRDRQAIAVLELPLPDPAPEGWDWIEAYRHWVEQGRS